MSTGLTDLIKPTLSPDEEAAMELIGQAMEAIQGLNGKRLVANHVELAAAIHVLQGFVVQSALGRLELFGMNAGWWQDLR